MPYIETERLILREIKRSDAKAVFEYAKHELVGPNAGWQAHDKEEDSIEYINYCIKKRDFGQPGVFAIIHKENYKMIGAIEVHSYKEYKAEIGFVLHPDYWNKGLATEASKAVIVYAMEILQLERLQYCHFKENIASKTVCKKLEFTFEGVLRNKYLMYDGRLMDDVTYSIIKEDYFSGAISWVEKFKKVLFIDY